MNLQNLTIVIITYNRHKYLKRTLNYWLNYDVKVLIIDGSNTKFEDICLQKKNVKYIHDQRSVDDRFLSSINFINTEFMIVSSDDEFFLPSTLSKCVDFLSINPSFSCCGGRAVGFRTKEKKILGIRQYPKLKNLCLDNENAADRVSKHFFSYVPAHFYSVIRTKKWKTICSYVFEKKYSFGSSSELQMEFLIMVSGKSKIISELMWMRNNEVAPINTELETPLQKWWYDKNYEKEKFSFLQRMKKACNELSTNINPELNEQAISKLFEVYVIKLLEHRKRNVLRKILSLLPIKIEAKLSKFIHKFYKIFTAKENSLEGEINILKAEGVLVNAEEIKQIISILRNSKHNDPNIY